MAAVTVVRPNDITVTSCSLSLRDKRSLDDSCNTFTGTEIDCIVRHLATAELHDFFYFSDTSLCDTCTDYIKIYK